MKNLIISLFLLNVAFAGTIINSKTEERITLDLNRQDRVIEIFSTAHQLINKSINLKVIKQETSNVNLNSIGEEFYEGLYGGDWFDHDCHFTNGIYHRCAGHVSITATYFIPVFNVPMLISGVADLVIMPFQLTKKLVQNMRMKKDFNIIMNAVNSKTTIRVSNKRFRRIEQSLK